MRGRCRKRDRGVEDQRDEPGDDEQQQNFAGRFRERPRATAARAAAATSWIQRGTTARGGSRAAARPAALGQPLAPRALGGADSRARPPEPSRSPASHHRQSMAEGPRRSDCVQPGGGASILFVGDLVGGLGRRTLLDCLPVLRERYDPTFVVVNGENVAGGLGHHAEDRRRAVRRRRRRDHARQPHLPPPRDLPLPGLRAADPAPGELPAQPARPRHLRGRARRRAPRASSTSAATSTCAPGARPSPRSRSRSASSARSTTCSSTCTPRRPPRRSRWAGTSTGA